MSKEPGQCRHCVRTTIWASFFAALFLTIFKVMIGLSGGSKALLGSALFSFTDLFSAVLLIIGFKVADWPPDKTHPYGHGKIEYVVSLVIGLVIAASTIALILLSTVALYQIDAAALPHWIAIWASLACFFLSTIIYRLVRCAARQSNSAALHSHAAHVRTDGLSNLVVILAIVVGEMGFREADAIIGILEGIQILYECVGMIRKSFGQLMDAALAGPQVDAVRALLTQNPAVVGVNDVRGTHVGRGISLDIEIQLDGTRTVENCSAVAREIERSLKRTIPHLHSVFVHYRPAPEI